jgi:DNA-binding transcriptional ArsR family regulator
VVVQLFEILADLTRRRLIEALRGGERSVTELVGHVEIHQPGVSRHLRILQEAGFVTVRKDGQKRLYSLRREPFDELEGWVQDYRRQAEARLDRFGAEVDSMTRGPRRRRRTRR